MKENLNKILLKRKNTVLLEIKETDNWDLEYKKAVVATASKNLESLGFYFSSTLAEKLIKMSVHDILKNVEFIKNDIIDRMGGNVEYKPLYPNFPTSVMERTNAQLYFDALVYALSGFKVLPYDPIIDNREKIEKISSIQKKLKAINLGDIDTVKEIVSNLMSSQISFSPEDKTDILTIYNEIGKKQFKELIPDKIPNKENLTWLASEFMKEMSPEENPFSNKMNSAIDILRLIVARNGGDSSLTEKVKFKTLPNKEIRYYVNALMNAKDVEPTMYQYSSLFKKINESYHLRNIKNKKWQTLLDKLYNKEVERTFLSKRDAAIKENDYIKLISLYKKNPGQMGADLSRLAYLTLKQDDYNLAKAVLNTSLKENAKHMSTTNLLRTESLIRSQKEKKIFNVYSPKKGLSNPYMKVNEREALPEDLVSMISFTIKDTLKEKYKEKRPLGKVYIEESLKNIKVPSQQRSNASGSVGMSFGSEFDLNKNVNYLRSFIWWTNKDNNPYHEIDIDLAATLYDKEFNKITDVSYYNIKGSGLGTHSGDIRDGGPKDGNGAAEFIDLDLKFLKERYPNAKIAMFSVYIYSGDYFVDTPCKFGWMQSDKKPEQLFDIKKVEKCIELNTNGDRSIPVLFDIENNKMIWMDRSPRSMANFSIKNLNQLNGGNNAITYMDSNFVEMYRAINTTTPDLHTLFELHALSRGELVEDIKEADTIFTVERLNKEDYPNAKELVCSYDNDLIVGDLIPSELSIIDKEYYKELEEKNKIEKEVENQEFEK